jgi:hypothetical protein
MEAHGVVTLSPSFDDALGFATSAEPLDAQAFVAKLPVLPRAAVPIGPMDVRRLMLPTNGGQSDQAVVDSSKASGAT